VLLVWESVAAGSITQRGKWFGSAAHAHACAGSGMYAGMFRSKHAARHMPAAAVTVSCTAVHERTVKHAVRGYHMCCLALLCEPNAK
jgi:hypothetical protein